MTGITQSPDRNPGWSLRRLGQSHPTRWLLVLLAVSILGGLSTGAADVSLTQVLRALWQGVAGQTPTAMNQAPFLVVWELRLPRVLMGGLIGAALAVSGAAMQAVFRNPLAEPGLIGVSSGAALAAVMLIVLGDLLLVGWLAQFEAIALPLAAFLGGLLTTAIIYQLSTQQGSTRVLTLLLAGIAISALSGAVTGMLTYIADDGQLRALTFWSMGSLGGMSWQTLWTAGPWMVLALVLMVRHHRTLNALLLGEQVAQHLGIRAQRMKKWLITLAALAVGAAVAVSGMIGFVGLVVPHLMRLWLGPDHRRLMPASLLGGASLLILADLVSRTIAAPAEIPIGIITALIGSPFFLWLLVSQSRRQTLE